MTSTVAVRPFTIATESEEPADPCAPRFVEFPRAFRVRETIMHTIHPTPACRPLEEPTEGYESDPHLDFTVRYPDMIEDECCRRFRLWVIGGECESPSNAGAFWTDGFCVHGHLEPRRRGPRVTIHYRDDTPYRVTVHEDSSATD